MENNTYENEVQQPVEQQPVEQQAEQYQPVEQQQEQPAGNNALADVAGKAKDLAKDLAGKAAPVVEKAKALPKKIWIIAGAALVAIIALIVVLSLLGNTYKTPIQAAEKLMNSKSLEKAIDNAPAVLNGFGEDEVKKLIKIAKKSDKYDDLMEDGGDYFEENIVQSLKDEYGDNYKVNIKIADKEKLDKDDLKEFRDQVRDFAEMGDQLDDIESSDYEEIGDMLGLSKSEVKEAVKILEGFCDECKTVKVTAGYELELVLTITGKEVDEPEEQEFTIRVYKVGGKWTPDWVTPATEALPGLLMGMAMGGMSDLGDMDIVMP